MALFRIGNRWDIQAASNWWLSIGIHIDHRDPSITLHLPGVILYVGRCQQPGMVYRDVEMVDDDGLPMFNLSWGLRDWLERRAQGRETE